jgi:beta-aspartyl-peptidase (threonine type)
MGKVDLTEVTASWGTKGDHGHRWAVLVHGGAGEIAVDRVPQHVGGCRAAASAAADVLRAGGSALDAVQCAVVVLEDDPSFNAATGACLNADGLIELDAAIMDGTELRAGGVCALPPFAHPIAIARAVLDDGRHVLYAGAGAERFAFEHGFARATSEALTTPWAKEQWIRAREKEARGRDDGTPGVRGPETGTVGAVARDSRGCLAAATSTGGAVYKHVGRVGDAPIPGAGTYADDESGACSATGRGEAILTLCLAKSAIDLLRNGALPERAARAVIRTLGARGRGAIGIGGVGAVGGVILVDRLGRLGWARSTGAMTWAAACDGVAEDLSGA